MDGICGECYNYKIFEELILKTDAKVGKNIKMSFEVYLFRYNEFEFTLDKMEIRDETFLAYFVQTETRNI